MKIENIYLKPYENLDDLTKVIEETKIKKEDQTMKWNR